jgi:hypothetical protein
MRTSGLGRAIAPLSLANHTAQTVEGGNWEGQRSWRSGVGHASGTAIGREAAKPPFAC